MGPRPRPPRRARAADPTRRTRLEHAETLAYAAGFPQVTDYLRHRYQTDALTTRQLCTELGLHPRQVAGCSAAADTPRHHDPTRDTEQALATVGFADLAGYATNRHTRGMTVQAMAAELGHSDTWLAPRLRAAGLGHLIGPPGRPRADPDTLAHQHGYRDLTDYATTRTAAGATITAMAAPSGDIAPLRALARAAG